MFDCMSYMIGEVHGYRKGLEDGNAYVEIETSDVCSDDGDGNITIEEEDE